jgi:transcriptional regulator with GAF, ATPase, and Fis domain
MNENEQELKSLQRDAADITGGELLSLNADVFELFYNLTVDPQQFPTESEICHEISLVLLRYWHLCTITTFLIDDAGQLQESAIHVDEHAAQSHIPVAAAELAAYVRGQNRECEVWFDDWEARAAHENSSHVCHAPNEVRERIASTGLKAAFAVPIHRRGNLVGVLVALSNAPADLREARRGMRFIALPIVIALAEARRAAAVREGREHIAELNRELQQNNHALEEANRELLRVARYRSLFLSRMSHDYARLYLQSSALPKFCSTTKSCPKRNAASARRFKRAACSSRKVLTRLLTSRALKPGSQSFFCMNSACAKCCANHLRRSIVSHVKAK